MSCSPQTQLICLPACIPQLVFACLFIVHTRARHYSCSSALPRATTHNKPISKQTHTHPTNTCHTKHTITHTYTHSFGSSAAFGRGIHVLARAGGQQQQAPYPTGLGRGCRAGGGRYVHSEALKSFSRPPTRQGLVEAVELVGAGACIESF